MNIALFIPTYNAISTCGDNFVKNLQIIKAANLNQVLIIDSSSTDNTVEIIKSLGFECIVIPKVTFDHGGTRQKALELLKSNDIIIYLTQDVLLENVASIDKIVAPLIKDVKLAGVYGRQLPSKNANLFAKHLRHFNYPKYGYICEYQDRYKMGMKSIFNSDSFSAYNVPALLKIGGFPNSLVLGEDVYVFARFLKNNFKVAYIPEAKCFHSHNYKIIEEFKRYFDIGVFHCTNDWMLKDFGHPNRLGYRYMYSELKMIKYRIWLWPSFVAKISAKYIGYKLGRNYKNLGLFISKSFSMNKVFWE